MNIKDRFEAQPIEEKNKPESDLENSQEKSVGRALKFEGVENKDVYNITKPFEFPDGRICILGRVESKEGESDSQVMFFEEKEGADSKKVWLPVEEAHVFEKMQDPFFSVINGKLIVGGVEIWDKAKWGDYMDVENEGFSVNSDERVGYRTVFYEVTNIDTVKEIAKGPEGMKDIRLVELGNRENEEDKKIGVFYRPEKLKTIWKKGVKEEIYLRDIAYTEIDSFDELNEKSLDNVEEQKIKGLFEPGEWGGVNEAYLLGDGMIGVLGHKAKIDEQGNKEYYAVAFVFVFDSEKHEFSEMETVAEAKIFGDKYEPKKDDLKNVIFPGGYDEDSNTLYGGLRDKHPIAITFKKKLFSEHGGIVKKVIKNV